jgi:hypothetical protein
LREVSAINGLDIILFSTGCAHQCLYCFFDNHKCAKSSFVRFSSVIERFMDWRETKKTTNFDVVCRRFYCDDVNPGVLKKEIELAARCHKYRPLYLGGLRMRPESEMRIWLQQQREAGVKVAYVSFAGYRDVHDKWNGRPGDFDFLINTMKIAAELGMVFIQRLFVMKSTLPSFEKLIDTLDDLPGKVKGREVYPLNYSGRAGRLEDERVTAADLKDLPERVIKSFTHRKNWRSEQEWMDIIQNEQEPPSIRTLLKLYLNDTNITRIESMSCEEIVADLESRTRAAYHALPTPQELCERCGDAANARLYHGRPDIERLWLNRYLKKHPVRFERQLTFLSMND